MELWECGAFLGLYALYVMVVVFIEKRSDDQLSNAPTESDASEKTPLVLTSRSTAEEVRETVASPTIGIDDREEITGLWGTPGNWERTLSMVDPFGTLDAGPWDARGRLSKVVAVVQLPLRVIITLSIPVVYVNQPMRSPPPNRRQPLLLRSLTFSVARPIVR